MKRPLIFVGTRNNQALLHITAELNGYEILGILDHHYYDKDKTVEINHVPIIGDERWLLDTENKQAQQWLKTCDFFISNWWYGSQHLNKDTIDLQQLRIDRISLLERVNANVINLIHPSSKIFGSDSKYASLKLGKGIFIDADCWISPCEVTIGDYCVVMMGARVAIHSELGFNVCIGPASYVHHCKIGDNSYTGTFTRVGLEHKKGHIEIGENVTTWVNSFVTKDIPSNCIHTDQGRILKKMRF